MEGTGSSGFGATAPIAGADPAGAPVILRRRGDAQGFFHPEVAIPTSRLGHSKKVQ
jgi:hypothetical protein